MVFQILNKLKWTSQLTNAKILILHRGAPENKKTIEGRRVTEVKRSYFLYEEGGKETFIPNHRVLEIKINNRIIWKR